MKADVFLVIGVLLVIYIAWVSTGGPRREASKAGPYITPVARTGEESQGYRVTPPQNPLNPGAYPRNGGPIPATLSKPDAYTRETGSATTTRTN